MTSRPAVDLAPLEALNKTCAGRDPFDWTPEQIASCRGLLQMILEDLKETNREMNRTARRWGFKDVGDLVGTCHPAPKEYLERMVAIMEVYKLLAHLDRVDRAHQIGPHPMRMDHRGEPCPVCPGCGESGPPCPNQSCVRTYRAEEHHGNP